MTAHSSTANADTCFIERSKVREILIRSDADNESTSDILRDIDALPIFTAGDFLSPAQNAPDPAGYWRGMYTDLLKRVDAGQSAQQTQWQPIEHRPLPSGKYLVGHRGHHEIMHFFGPEKMWVKGTQFGWHRFTDKGWQPDDPVTRFHATHCWLIEGPSFSSTELGGSDGA